MFDTLERQTIEVDSWVTDLLHKSGIDLYPVEGYSVSGNCMTTLFERRASNVDVKNWTGDESKVRLTKIRSVTVLGSRVGSKE